MLASALCNARGLVLGLALAAPGSVRACEAATFVVAVDPGHTRASPGAISARGVTELQFNEQLSQRVLIALRHAGFAKAFLTNRRGDATSLAERAQRANERDASLFVSIHHDSAQPQLLSSWTYGGQKRSYIDELHGYSLFVSDKNGDAAGSLRFAQLLGQQLRLACFVPTLHHAQNIPGEGRELLDETLGIYRFNDLFVLKSTRMAAVLFEAGLIVNRQEELRLRSVSHQVRLAGALTRAVLELCEGALPQSAPAAPCP